MSLRVRLTLWSVLVMTAIVTTVSFLDLTEEVTRQFEVTLKRSVSIRRLVHSAVLRSIERTPRKTIEESIRDDERFTAELLELLTESQALVEIAICDPHNIILNDSDADRQGNVFAPTENFENLVTHGSWFRKLQVLLRGQGTYQLSNDLFDPDTKKLLLTERVVIDPALIREEVRPALSAHAAISVAIVLGAMFAALIFSTIAFRPLGRLGHTLDLLAKGEYELQPGPEAGREDQFGMVESKVSLLGQQLRGVQSEISDLKGNVERLLDELEDAVFIFGRDRRLIAAAGAVDRFLTQPRAELLGRPLAEVFPAGTSLGLLLAQATQTARPIRNRRVPLDPVDGKMVIALLSVEFMDVSTAGMLIRLRDPEATRQIGRKIETADRLSAISRLTSGVAHEVKNPLNAILMHVELAKMKLNHGDYDLNPQMDVISNEILRLDRVVKTFLDFTRPVQLNLSDLPLQNFVSEIVELAAPQAAAGAIEVNLVQGAEPVSVTVDADLIKQAVLNIVVNAIEAMPEGGQLRIESGVRGDFAEIKISDTGPGIAPEVRDKIYNLYFTTKEHGSGIGLAMTFRIIQLHDGTIDFASQSGKGTTFTIRLPVAVLAA